MIYSFDKVRCRPRTARLSLQDCNKQKLVAPRDRSRRCETHYRTAKRWQARMAAPDRCRCFFILGRAGEFVVSRGWEETLRRRGIGGNPNYDTVPTLKLL